MRKYKTVRTVKSVIESITCDMCGAASEGIGPRWPAPNVSNSFESHPSAYEIKLECVQKVDTYGMGEFEGECEEYTSIDMCHDCWVKLVGFLKSEGMKNHA